MQVSGPRVSVHAAEAEAESPTSRHILRGGEPVALMLPTPTPPARVVRLTVRGRGLHSSTFQLNLSALYGIGGARKGI